MTGGYERSIKNPRPRDPVTGHFVLHGVRRKDWRRFRNREVELWRDHDRWWPEVLAEGVLELEAIEPPKSPAGVKNSMVISGRVDRPIGQWARREAQERGQSVSEFVADCLRHERDRVRPADVDEWLGLMANQLGMPGDLDYALTRVLRHLMDRWPRGARLAETREYKERLAHQHTQPHQASKDTVNRP